VGSYMFIRDRPSARVLRNTHESRRKTHAPEDDGPRPNHRHLPEQLEPYPA
jgi:hypothetical protein